MSDVATLLGQVSPLVAYGMLACALLIESNLVFGVFVPTLTLMVTAGALAQTGYLSLPVVVAVAVCAVVTADLIGFHTGRHFGDRLRTNRVGRRIPAAMWVRADAVMARHGGRAVLPARFVPLLRTVVPHIAGATRVPYRKVAPYSVTAACVWAAVEAGAGYAAATSVHKIMNYGIGAFVVLLLVAAGGFALVARRRRRRSACAGTTSQGSSVIASNNRY